MINWPFAYVCMAKWFYSFNYNKMECQRNGWVVFNFDTLYHRVVSLWLWQNAHTNEPKCTIERDILYTERLQMNVKIYGFDWF